MKYMPKCRNGCGAYNREDPQTIYKNPNHEAYFCSDKCWRDYLDERNKKSEGPGTGE